MIRVIEIEGSPSPQFPLRVLGLFAQQDVLPKRVEIESEDDVCRMRLVEFHLDEFRSAIIAEKLRSMVMVTHVRVLTSETEKSCLVCSTSAKSDTEQP